MVKDFEKIVEYGKSIGVELKHRYNDFYIYMCILNDMDCYDRKLNAEEINQAIDIVKNAWLETECDTDVSISRISEYVVNNFEKAQDMSRKEIIECIVNGDYDYDDDDYDEYEDEDCED